MSSRTYSTTGVILKRINVGEADKILTIYTKHFGKIRAIARGVRKINSRKAGNIEPFVLLKLFLAKGRNLDILAEAQVVNRFSAWRDNFIKMALVYYAGELVDKLTPDNQSDEAIFDSFLDFLYKIGEAESGTYRSCVINFEKELLTLAGFGVPSKYQNGRESLKPYIESIVGKPIKSASILKKIDTNGNTNKN